MPSSRDPDPVSGAGGVGSDGYGGSLTGGDGEGGMSPLAGVVAGAVGVMLAIVMAAVVLARRRCYSVRRRAPDLVSGQGECLHFPWTCDILLLEHKVSVVFILTLTCFHEYFRKFHFDMSLS